MAGLSYPRANPFDPSYNSFGEMGMNDLSEAPAFFGRGVPQQPPEPQVMFSPSTRKVFVNGALFDEDDHASALDSVNYLDRPPTPPPATASDWTRLPPENYGNYINSIRNPSLGRLASKNVGIGVDQGQMLTGYGLQYLGAEETGRNIVAQQKEDLRKTQPYERNFTDIDSTRGAIEWFVANFAQQVPMILGFVASSLAGAAGGAVAGGGVAGALEAIVGRTAFKKGVMAAAKKYAKGEAVDATEAKLLQEASSLTAASIERNPTLFVNRAGVALNAGENMGARAILNSPAARAISGAKKGAIVGPGLLNYGTGVSDIYGEMAETGTEDRAKAALYAIPYAALESLPEFTFAAAALGGVGRNLLRGRNRLLRGAAGIGAGAALEGTTEAGQEALLMGATGQPINMSDKETYDRILNAFAAGAGVGGVFGGAAGALRKGKPTNILDSAEPVEPESTEQPVEDTEETQQETQQLAFSPTVPTQDERGQAALNVFSEPMTSQDLETLNQEPLVGEPIGEERPEGEDLFPGTYPLSQNKLQERIANPQVEPENMGPLGYALMNAGKSRNEVLAQQQQELEATRQTQGQQQQQRAALDARDQAAFEQMELQNQEQEARNLQALQEQEEQEATSNYELPPVESIEPVAPLKNNSFWYPTNQGQFAFGRSTRSKKPVQGAKPTAYKGEVLKAKKSQLVPNIKQKGKENALPQQSPAKVDVREQARAGKRMGRGNTQEQALAKKGEALKRGQVQTRQEKGVQQKGPVQTKTVTPAFNSLAEAWNHLAPEKSVSFSELPIIAQREFARQIRDNKATQRTVKSLHKRAKTYIGKGPSEVIETAIMTMSGDETVGSRRYAASTLIEKSYFNEDSSSADARREAHAWLDKGMLTERTGFSPAERIMVNKAFVQTANNQKGPLRATSNEEELSPWFAYALHQGLLDQIKTSVEGVPKKYQSLMRAKPASTASIDEIIPDSATNEIVETIASIYLAYQQATNPTYTGTISASLVTGKERGALDTRLTSLYKKADKSYLIRGAPLNSYFKNGRPLIKEDGGIYFVDSEKAIAHDDSTWGDDPNEIGLFSIDDNKELKTSLNIVRLNVITNRFLKGLQVKPRVTIVRNLDELKSKHPALYKRAAASRKNGDFDTIAATRAQGFSVGNEVILFGNKMRCEQQVKFVLAHEVLGHFGFRALLSKDKLNKELDSIYKGDSHMRAVVDRRVAVGVNKMEAIEEAVADKVAELNTNILSKLMNMLKNALNKLGLAFADDNVRYLTTRARKNLRDGYGITSAGMIRDNIEAIKAVSAQGRFSVEVDSPDVGSVLGTMRDLNRQEYDGTPFDAVKKIVENAPRNAKNIMQTMVQAMEHLQTLNHKAMRNEGLSVIFTMVQNSAARVQTLLSDYQQITTTMNNTRHKKKMQEQVGELLAYAAAHRGKKFTEEAAKKIPDLVVIDDMGVVGINEEALKKVKAIGRILYEEFNKGIPYTDEIGNETIKKFSFNITDEMWKIYNEAREVVDRSAIDVLRANVDAILSQREDIIEKFKRYADLNIGVDMALQIQSLRDIIAKYEALYSDSTRENIKNSKEEMELRAKAERFLKNVNRTLLGNLKIEDWRTGKEDMAEFQGAAYKKTLKALETLFKMKLKDKAVSDITNSISALNMMKANIKKAELRAKQTIMGAYVPFTRKGKYQIQLKAVDEDGDPIEIANEYAASLPFYTMETKSQADDMAKILSDLLGDNTFKIPVKLGKGLTEPRTVSFRVEHSSLRKAKAVTDSVNYTQVSNILSRLGINLGERERKKLITELTAADERIRRSLRRARKPGWDRDIIQNIAEYLQTQAHIAGKATYSHRINNVMLENHLWIGDEKLMKAKTKQLAQAEKDYEAGNITREYLRQVEQDYDRYAFMYRESAPTGAPSVLFRNEKAAKPNKGRGREYQTAARNFVSWYSEHLNATESSEDLLSGAVGSRLKMAAVLMQLGGNLATAFINQTALVTHSSFYLATYNKDRGYGGGFGYGAAAAAIARSTGNLANPKLSDAGYLKNVMESAQLRDKHGLSLNEARFLYEITREGILQAAQFNALIGTARGGLSSKPRVASLIQKWMFPFTYTEQLNRRATALASFRLERDRGRTAYKGKLTQAQEETVFNRAAKEAHIAVNKSQGEYAMYNRPEMARGNILQYLFMYKQFLILTVEMMSSMARSDRVKMLAMLMLFSGIKGVPFSDDLMDLIDTILQRFGPTFGITKASVEKELALFVDDMIPGAAPIFMRGILDAATGTTLSSRLGFGDLIPMSGIAKKGLKAEDYIHELENFAGPVFGGLSGMVQTIYGASGSAVGALTGDTSAKSLSQVLRESPIAGLRNFVDGWAYLDSGAITNKQGKIVAEDASIGEGLARMLGLYPARATLSYDVIRIGRQVENYTGAIRATWISQYVRARIANDRTEANNILKTVNHWNRNWRGTEYELKGFRRGAIKAFNSARHPAVERFTKYAPRNMRPMMKTLTGIYGVG